MVSNEVKLAKQQLERLNETISSAESNLRILKSVNDPRVLELQSNLDNAILKRNELLRAIDTEIADHDE